MAATRDSLMNLGNDVSSRLELERYRAAAFQSFQEMCHCTMWISICIQSAIVGQSQEHEEI